MALPARSPSRDNDAKSYNMEVRTSDATQTTLQQLHTVAGGAYQVKAFLQCKTADASAVGGWEITGTFKNVSGTASLVGALDTIANTDSAATVTLSTTGNKITALVTGIAATNILWRGNIEIRKLELAQ